MPRQITGHIATVTDTPMTAAAPALNRLTTWRGRLFSLLPSIQSRPIGHRSAQADSPELAASPFAPAVDLATLTPADAPQPTIGAVDSVQVTGDLLVIDGWLLAADLAGIDSLAVSRAGGVLPDADLRIGLPSPEVASHLDRDPDSSAAFARYRVQVPLPGGVADRPSGHIVTLLPTSRGRALRPVVVAHDTTIPIPSEAMALRIGGGFLDVALEFMGYFQQLTHLVPADRVLEIGCGLGRIAYPLAYYLDGTGSYQGFDIDTELIDWANDTIGAARSNFHFLHADVHNPHYNPHGRLTPEAFSFPPDTGSIDYALAVSLFTHLPAAAARHYLLETGRVLRSGGTAFITAFLIDEAAKQAMADGKAILHLGQEAAGGLVMDAANPEAAIGFPAATFLGWMAEAGLEVSAVYPGNWSGRAPHLSFQDIVIARRVL